MANVACWYNSDLPPCLLSRRCWGKSEHQRAGCAISLVSTRPSWGRGRSGIILLWLPWSLHSPTSASLPSRFWRSGCGPEGMLLRLVYLACPYRGPDAPHPLCRASKEGVQWGQLSLRSHQPVGPSEVPAKGEVPARHFRHCYAAPAPLDRSSSILSKNGKIRKNRAAGFRIVTRPPRVCCRDRQR